MDINKKVIIITGGANGIGLEIAKKFVKNGANVYVLDIDSSKKTLLNRNNINFYCCNISINLEVKKCIQEILLKEKKIDILANNASKQIISEFENYREDDYIEIMKTNFIGACNCIHNVIPNMHSGSTILNILSVHSSKPRKDKYAYDCSKSVLELLTKELALELANKQITINGLSFGAVNTMMNSEWKRFPKLKKIAKENVPLGIIFEPQQIANFCFTVINQFSTYTTGTIFTIDGGRSLL